MRPRILLLQLCIEQQVSRWFLWWPPVNHASLGRPGVDRFNPDFGIHYLTGFGWQYTNRQLPGGLMLKNPPADAEDTRAWV